MSALPIRNNVANLLPGTDDDESQSGLESQSGIFTTDGQSTVNFRGAQGAGGINVLDTTTTVRAYDTTFDESLVSGIEDASFLLNESLYRTKVRDEEKMVRDEYSLDESSLDLGEYITNNYHNNNNGSTSAAGNVNVSTDAHAPTTNPSYVEDSVFSGAYNRVLKTFMFKSSSNKKASESSDEEAPGKNTPKTLSPKDSQELEVFEAEGGNDDDAESNDTASVGRPKTIILGKTPRTPQQGSGGKKPADTPRTTSSTVMTTVSDTKILGLRLSRLVIIILFVFVAAVAVAVGSAVASQKKQSSLARDAASPGLGDATATFPTNSPMVPTTATAAPTYFSQDGEDENDGSYDGGEDETAMPTGAPGFTTLAPSVGATAAPTGAPFAPPTGTPTTAPFGAPTTVPTMAPSVNATQFPCGSDDDERSFTLFGQARDCVWFR